MNTEQTNKELRRESSDQRERQRITNSRTMFKPSRDGGERNTRWVLCALSWLIHAASVMAQGLPVPGGDPEPQVLVGELSGEFVVDNTGAAGYGVPLSISPGTAGIQPKLAVGYSSQGGNGLLGVGFALNGLSVIARGGTSLGQDDFIDGVDFDDNDRFMLDGQRLMLVSTNGAAYGDAGSEYRTEIDSFARVVAFGQAGNGPASFKVWTKSGLLYEYGNSTDSSFEPGSHSSVLSWAVNRVSDSVGNYMTFSYTTNSAGSLISRIDYTGNENGLTPYNSVEFEYEGRPDAASRFFMGAPMEQTNRLAKIVMKHNGDYMHDYRLTYTNSAAGESLVESVQQFFVEGDCLPANRFEYSGCSTSERRFSYTSGTSLPSVDHNGDASNPVLTGDFNGDGKADMCSMGYSASQRWLGLSNGDGSFVYISGTNVLEAGLDFENSSIGNLDQLLSGDFNGDGLTDLCCMGTDETHRWLGLSSGDGKFTFTSGTNLLDSSLDFENWRSSHGGGFSDSFITVDFNGDGLTDICAMGATDDRRWLGLSGGDGKFTFTSGTDLLDSELGFNSYSGSSDRLLSADFNGDGLNDLCAVGNDESSRWVGLSIGDGTFDFVSGTNFLPSAFGFENNSSGAFDQVLSADFNGDGLSDLACMGRDETHRWVGLSNGNGTFNFVAGTNLLDSGLAFENWNDTYGAGYSDRFMVSDFNADGLTDLCVMGSYNRWVGLSNGDGAFNFVSGTNLLDVGLEFSSRASGNSDQLLALDFNGDGLSDLCSMGSDATHRWMGLSNGDGTFDFVSGTNLLDSGLDYENQTSGDADVFFAADFDGDGMADLCGLGEDESHRWVGLNGREAPLLTKVVQGWQSETEHGVVTEIEYLPLTDANAYIKGSGAVWPIVDVVPTTPVVSRLAKDNGLGGTYCMDYSYRSARFDMHGRGFLGFQQFRSYDREKQLSYIETLAHDFPFTGRALKSETSYIPDPEGNPSAPGYARRLKLVENDWFFDLVSGGSIFSYYRKINRDQMGIGTDEYADLGGFGLQLVRQSKHGTATADGSADESVCTDQPRQPCANRD